MEGDTGSSTEDRFSSGHMLVVARHKHYSFRVANSKGKTKPLTAHLDIDDSVHVAALATRGCQPAR